MMPAIHSLFRPPVRLDGPMPALGVMPDVNGIAHVYYMVPSSGFFWAGVVHSDGRLLLVFPYELAIVAGALRKALSTEKENPSS